MLRFIFTKPLFVLFLLLCAAPTVCADSPSVTIQDVMQAALNQSIVVGEIENKLSAVSADALDVRTFHNPELEVAYGVPTNSVGKDGKDEIDIALIQPIRLSSGPLRKRLSRLMEAAGSQEKEREILELFVQVKLAYGNVWVLSERRLALKELAMQAATFHEFVKSGASAGAYGEAERLVFQAEAAKLNAEMKGVEAAELLARAALSRLVGKAFTGHIFQEPEFGQMASVDSLKTKLDAGGAHVQARSKLLAELAAADAAVAHRDAFPELRPKLFYSRANDGADIVGLGVSFDLPFYSRNASERGRKVSVEKTAMRKQQFFQSAEFKDSVMSSVNAYSLRREQVALYQQKVLPVLSQALRVFEKQVRRGSGDVFELWQTLREYLDTHQRYLELWAQAYSEHTEISLLLEEEI